MMSTPSELNSDEEEKFHQTAADQTKNPFSKDTRNQELAATIGGTGTARGPIGPIDEEDVESQGGDKPKKDSLNVMQEAE